MQIGDIIDGKYELIRLLGQGGMGKVFEARHTVIKRRVALKCLHDEVTDDASAVTRFIHEAQAAAAIGSEHIIEVTDAGTLPSGTPYIVMEYLDGEDLGAILLREEKLLPERAAALVQQACRGLGAAHRVGIVHRDLKPENLYVTQREDGQEWVKVLDFGIAKFQDLRLTPTGLTLGTPYYMSPEQAYGSKSVDSRSDVYSMGVILYEALTGVLPFPGDSIGEIVGKIIMEDPIPLRAVEPSVSKALERVVMRAMARAPDDRYQSMADLAEALSCHVGSSSPAMETRLPVETFERHRLQTAHTAARDAPRRGRRRLGALAVGGASLVVTAGIVAGVLFLWQGGRRPEPRPLPARVPVAAKAPPALAKGPPAPAKIADRAHPPPPVQIVESRAPPPPAKAVVNAARREVPGEWVRVDAGSFTMGSPRGEHGRDDDEAQHDVILSRGFLMQATEVTIRQFSEVMSNVPSRFTGCGLDCPAHTERWHPAAAYCNRLSQRAGLEECYTCSGDGMLAQCSPSQRFLTPYDCPGYRLPTEAEWEYAARAGTETPVYTGSLRHEGLFWSPSLDPIAWYVGNSAASYPDAWDCSNFGFWRGPGTACGPHPVKQKQPNRHGLYDMLGNAAEWCHDWFGEYPRGTVRDPFGPPNGGSRVIRGGSWMHPAPFIRAAKRMNGTPDVICLFCGFRPVRTVLP